MSYQIVIDPFLECVENEDYLIPTDKLSHQWDDDLDYITTPEGLELHYSGIRQWFVAEIKACLSQEDDMSELHFACGICDEFPNCSVVWINTREFKERIGKIVVKLVDNSFQITIDLEGYNCIKEQIIHFLTCTQILV